MTENSIMSMADRWPEVTRTSQKDFWDNQAETYAERSITGDNQLELSIVQMLCADFVERGYTAEDVVTLGGANGCRDPRVVVDALAQHGQKPQTVYFNDLSERMVEIANATTLAELKKSSIAVSATAGAIHECLEFIPSKPRRVILGIYKTEALVNTNKDLGHSISGIDGYTRNTGILGSRFTFEAVSLVDDRFVPANVEHELKAHTSPLNIHNTRRIIGKKMREKEVSAIQVLGFLPENLPQFISHWYTERGIADLLRGTFDGRRLVALPIQSCEKGYVICIDPVDPPQGIVTILNNVLGNVLPHEQADTLRVIDRMSS